MLIKPIGLMQGRLTPPNDYHEDSIQFFPSAHWEYEFEQAAKIGLDYIEWIIEEPYVNPILDFGMLSTLKELQERTGVKIGSICLDYFVKHKIWEQDDWDKNKEVLIWTMGVAKLLGISVITIPVLDEIEDFETMKSVLYDAVHHFGTRGSEKVRLALELDLNSKRTISLMRDLSDIQDIGITYDIGNNHKRGVHYDLERLMPWIYNIHIKEKNDDGETVPFLSFSKKAWWVKVFRIINENYSGGITLQLAREKSHEEEATVKRYLEEVKELMDV